MEAQITEQALALRARDGIALAVREWNAPDIPVRAVMVVAHGMGEHSGRYGGPLGPVIASGVRTYALDPERARALWAKSEEMVGERF